MQRILAFTMALATAMSFQSRAADDAAGKPVRIAVCGFAARDASSSVVALGRNVTDLTFIDLAADRDIQLVEREQIQQVLKELKLSVQSFAEPATAVKVGQMLGADLLVFGAHFREGSNDVVVAKVVESPSTLVRELAVLSVRGDAVRSSASQLTAMIRHARLPRPAGQETCLIGVGSFQASGGMPLYGDLHEQIYLHLTETYAKRPGISLLERTHLDWLMTERQLVDAGYLGFDGLTNAAHVASLFVSGRYSLKREQVTTIEVQLQVQDAGGRKYDVPLSAESVPALLPKITQTLDSIIASRQHAPGAEMTPEQRQMEITAHLKRVADRCDFTYERFFNAHPVYFRCPIRYDVLIDPSKTFNFRTLKQEDVPLVREALTSVLLLDPQHEQARFFLGFIDSFCGERTAENVARGRQALQDLADNAADPRIRYAAAVLFWREDAVTLPAGTPRAPKSDLYGVRATDWGWIQRGCALRGFASAETVNQKFGAYVRELCAACASNLVETTPVSAGGGMANLDRAVQLFVAMPDLSSQRVVLAELERGHPSLAPYFAFRLWAHPDTTYYRTQVEMEGLKQMLHGLSSGAFRPWNEKRFYSDMYSILVDRMARRDKRLQNAGVLYKQQLDDLDYVGCAKTSEQMLLALCGEAPPPAGVKPVSPFLAAGAANVRTGAIAAVAAGAVAVTGCVYHAASLDPLFAELRAECGLSYDALLAPLQVRHLLLPHERQENFKGWDASSLPKVVDILRRIHETAPTDEEGLLYYGSVLFYTGNRADNEEYYKRPKRTEGWQVLTNLVLSAKDDRIRCAAALVSWQEDQLRPSDALYANVHNLETVQAIWDCRRRLQQTQAGPARDNVHVVLTPAAFTRGIVSLSRALYASPATGNTAATNMLATCVGLLDDGRYYVADWNNFREQVHAECPDMETYFLLFKYLQTHGDDFWNGACGKIAEIRGGSRRIWNPACFCRFVVNRIEKDVADDVQFAGILPDCRTRLAANDLDGCMALVSSVIDRSDHRWEWKNLEAENGITLRVAEGSRLMDGRLDSSSTGGMEPLSGFVGAPEAAPDAGSRPPIAVASPNGRFPPVKPWLRLKDDVFVGLGNDSNGDLLVVTANAKVGRLRNGEQKIVFLSLQHSPEWMFGAARPTVLADRERIWIGAANGLIEYRKSDGQERVWGPQDGLLNPCVLSCSLAGNSRLWLDLAESRGGYIDLATGHFVGVPELGTPTAIASSQNGGVWELSRDHTHGVYYFHPDTKDILVLGPSPGKGKRYVLAASPWYVVTGVEHGLSYFDIGGGRMYRIDLGDADPVYAAATQGRIALVSSVQDAWLIDLARGKAVFHWTGLGQNGPRSVSADAAGFWLACNECLFRIDLAALGVAPTAWQMAGPQPTDPVSAARATALKFAAEANQVSPEERLDLLLDSMFDKNDENNKASATQIAKAAREICTTFVSQQDPVWHRRHLSLLSRCLDRLFKSCADQQEMEKIGTVLQNSSSPYLKYVCLFYFHKPGAPGRVLAEGELSAVRLEETVRFCQGQKESWFTDRIPYLLYQLGDAWAKAGDITHAEAAQKEAQTAEQAMLQRVLGGAPADSFVEQHMASCTNCRAVFEAARRMAPLEASEPLNYRRGKTPACELARSCEYLRVAAIQPEAIDPWAAVSYMASFRGAAARSNAQCAVQQAVTMLHRSAAPWAPFYCYYLETEPQYLASPDHPLSNTAERQREAERGNQLVNRFEQLQDVWPCTGMAEIYRKQAQRCDVSGNHQQAAEYVRKSIGILGPPNDKFLPDRERCESWRALASEYLALGQRSKALEALDRSVQIDRQLRDAHENLKAYVVAGADSDRIVRLAEKMFAGNSGFGPNNLNCWARDDEPTILDPSVVATCYEHCVPIAQSRATYWEAQNAIVLTSEFKATADLAREKAARIRATLAAAAGAMNALPTRQP